MDLVQPGHHLGWALQPVKPDAIVHVQQQRQELGGTGQVGEQGSYGSSLCEIPSFVCNSNHFVCRKITGVPHLLVCARASERAETTHTGADAAIKP